MHKYFKYFKYFLVIPIIVLISQIVNPNSLLYKASAQSITANTYQIISGTDDGYDVAGSTTFVTGSPVFSGGKNASGNVLTAGFRFSNVTIPQGSIITSAKLDWQESWTGNYGANVKVNIYGEATDESATFSNGSLPRNRVKTTAVIGYNSVSEQINADTWLSITSSNKPPEIKTIIQEIIDRPGWNSGNALSVILADNGSVNDWWWEFKSYEIGAASAPKLTISYDTNTNPTSAPTPTPTTLYTISGTVYNDENRNGIKDGTESGYAGATVTIQGGTSQATTTNSLGNYSFTNLAAGSYGLTLTAPTGYDVTTTNPFNTTINADTTVGFGVAIAPTPTPGGATPTPTPTSVTTNTTSFTTGKAGFVDAIPRQLVRTNTDKLYMLAGRAEGSPVIQAYWTANAGVPDNTASFSGSTSVTDSAAILSADAAYDGGNIIHVLVNTNAGAVKDYPFDITTNTFKPAIILATGNPTVSGNYIGTQGVSSMIDTSGKLHVSYWSASNHITYRSYTYVAGTNALTLTEGPTQIDTTGAATHPSLVISPVDGLITIAWISEATNPARILSRTRASNGTWGSVQIATTGNVWVSTNFGINIDQGPSIVIDSNNVKHMVYMESFDTSGDYGRLHYVTQAAGASTWTDTALSTYSHAPGIALNSANELYIIGHGHPFNTTVTTCKSMLNMCYIKKNTDNTWSNQQLLLTASGSDSLDASVSVKWGVAGWNRPETIEFLYFAALAGSYQNTHIYYGRFASSGPVLPTNTPTPTAPAPQYTLSGTVYEDINSNGVQDAGENGYNNAILNLSNGASTTSTANGIFTFGSLPAATYSVTLITPTGYTPTTSNPVSVALAANSSVNFGIAITPTTPPTNTPTVTPIPTNTPTPTLPLTPTPTSVGGQPVTITKQVTASLDDTSEVNGALTSSTSSTFWIGNSGSTTTSFSGMRFNNVTIPRGAQIQSAVLQVYSAQSQWITIGFIMRAEAIGNSPTFSASSRPSQRALTIQQIAHTSDVRWNANTWYTLNDMTPVIQELVNRGDWSSGNALSVILKGTGGKHGNKVIRSFNGSPTNAPKLVITYR